MYVLAMNLAEAHELGPLQSRNHPHNSSLIAESQVILKSDQIVAIGAQILFVVAEPPRMAHCARFVDRPAQRASLARIEASPARAAPTLRSAGKLQKMASCLLRYGPERCRQPAPRR